MGNSLRYERKLNEVNCKIKDQAEEFYRQWAKLSEAHFGIKTYADALQHPGWSISIQISEDGTMKSVLDMDVVKKDIRSAESAETGRQREAEIETYMALRDEILSLELDPYYGD